MTILFETFVLIVVYLCHLEDTTVGDCHTVNLFVICKARSLPHWEPLLF